MFGRTILTVLLLLWAQDSVNSVRLTELRVPTDMPEGGMALLSCHYDMGADTLYSVKWYKDSQEFYRYVPKNEPPVYFFPVAGVHVDLTRSSNTVVALTNLTQASEGVYRCEVSGEAPGFATAYRERKINVHLLPKTGPRITSSKDEYGLGEMVVANCSLPPASKATLKWILNDLPAPPQFVQEPWFRVSADRPDAAETKLQIRFITNPLHFANGAIKLKCQATIPPLYQSQTETKYYLALPPNEVNVMSSAAAAASLAKASDTNDASVVEDSATDAASSEAILNSVLMPIILALLSL